MLDLRHDVVGPVLEELAVELRNHRIILDNRLNRQPAEVIAGEGQQGVAQERLSEPGQ